MKKIIYSILSVIFAFTLNNLNAQSISERCTTDERMQEKMEDPQFALEYQALQEQVAEKLIENKGQAPCANPLVIPVVVHFQQTNIPNQCMIDATLAQIDQMNDDFASCNSNAGLLCEWINEGCDNFGGSAGADAMPDDGACIQFCLGDQNLPNDNNLITGGYAITTTYNGNNQNAPASNTNTTQGASVLTSAFGSQAFTGCNGVDTAAPYDGGATLTHEVGHWFGLDHTFSDNLADTPPQNQPNYGGLCR